MPKLGGIEAVREIIEDDPDAKIIMVTAAGQKANMIEALKRVRLTLYRSLSIWML